MSYIFKECSLLKRDLQAMPAGYTTVARVDEKNLQVDKSLSSFRPTLTFLQHSVYSTFLFFTSDCNMGVLTDTNSL